MAMPKIPALLLMVLLCSLPSAPLLSQAEVLGFIDRHALAGRGVSVTSAGG